MLRVTTLGLLGRDVYRSDRRRVARHQPPRWAPRGCLLRTLFSAPETPPQASTTSNGIALTATGPATSSRTYGPTAAPAHRQPDAPQYPPAAAPAHRRPDSSQYPPTGALAWPARPRRRAVALQGPRPSCRVSSYPGAPLRSLGTPRATAAAGCWFVGQQPPDGLGPLGVREREPGEHGHGLGEVLAPRPAIGCECPGRVGLGSRPGASRPGRIVAGLGSSSGRAFRG